MKVRQASTENNINLQRDNYWGSRQKADKQIKSIESTLPFSINSAQQPNRTLSHGQFLIQSCQENEEENFDYENQDLDSFESLLQKLGSLEGEYMKHKRSYLQREKSLKDRLKYFESKLFDLQEQYQTVVQQNTQLNQQISVLQAQLQEVELLKHERSKELLHVKFEREQFQRDFNNLDEEYADLDNKFKDGQSKLSKEVEELKQQLHEQKLAQDLYKDQNQDLQLRIEQCLNLLSNQEEQFQEETLKFQGQIQKQKEIINLLNLEKEQISQSLNQMRDKFQQVDQIDQQLKEALQILENENTRLYNQYEKTNYLLQQEIKKNEQAELRRSPLDSKGKNQQLSKQNLKK